MHVLTTSLSAIVAVVLISLAVSAVSMTLTMAKISQPFREWLDRVVNRWASTTRSGDVLADLPPHDQWPRRARALEWFAELMSCPYCFSHWLAFAVVVVYQPRPVMSWFWFGDMTISLFLIVALASYGTGLIMRAFSHD